MNKRKKSGGGIKTKMDCEEWRFLGRGSTCQIGKKASVNESRLS